MRDFRVFLGFDRVMLFVGGLSADGGGVGK